MDYLRFQLETWTATDAALVVQPDGKLQLHVRGDTVEAIKDPFKWHVDDMLFALLNEGAENVGRLYVLLGTALDALWEGRSPDIVADQARIAFRLHKDREYVEASAYLIINGPSRAFEKLEIWP